MTSDANPILNVPAEEQAAIEDIRDIDDPLDRLHAYAERLSSLPWTSAALIRVLALEMAALLIEQEARHIELKRRVSYCGRNPAGNAPHPLSAATAPS